MKVQSFNFHSFEVRLIDFIKQVRNIFQRITGENFALKVALN